MPGRRSCAIMPSLGSTPCCNPRSRPRKRAMWSRPDLTKCPAMSIERFHLEAEAARIAYMMREQHIGDPAHVNVDVARILTPEFAEEYGGKIRMDRTLDLPVVTPPMNPSTIYITVVDKDRNVCSFINSIAHAFGSAIVSNKTGVLLQNRGR